MPEPYTTFRSRLMPLGLANVDTDQILPARFLNLTRAEGLDKVLFRDLRLDDDGLPRADSILNDPARQGAKVLLARDNFGSGSSREGAVYSLYDSGYRAVLASGFGDIFHSNALKNGLLPVTLPADQIEALLTRALADPGYRLSIDLKAERVFDDAGAEWPIRIDPFQRELLLSGRDELSHTLQLMDRIISFEAADTNAPPPVATPAMPGG
ncbi:3-isopropylmalate dehydratase small subunit [Pseudochelatococcus lubricantis]|uniref:3-isopropylmalate dehydratase small subunit n=1 Tax=Pseudochelatococcus lubricantis TaxID=1538102 RepID=UPI0035EC0FAD